MRRETGPAGLALRIEFSLTPAGTEVDRVPGGAARGLIARGERRGNLPDARRGDDR